MGVPYGKSQKTMLVHFGKLVVSIAAALAISACSQSQTTLPSPLGNPPFVHAAIRPDTLPVIALTGVNLPTMGIVYPGHTWKWTYQRFFDSAVMNDIEKDLHADFVRTGWIPNWVRLRGWAHIDQAMDSICKNSHLGVWVLVPELSDDKLGLADLQNSVNEFFTRYLPGGVNAEPQGCIFGAEIGNENDVATINGTPNPGYLSPSAYASTFEALDPVIYNHNITTIVTGGISGFDMNWFKPMAQALNQWCYPATACTQPAGYGVHPYNTYPGAMQSAIDLMASFTRFNDPSRIYATEYGNANPQTLSNAILALDHQPLVNIYEYRCQSVYDACQYALKSHPSLFKAVASAFETICTNRTKWGGCGQAR